MRASWLFALLVLPGNALIVFPALILYASDGFAWNSWPWLWLPAILLFLLGFALALSCMLLFAQRGKGTLAPWTPPQYLLVQGPYAYVRNPMLSGVLLMLVAMSLMTASFWLGGYTLFFFALNTLYFRYSEEPGLERRFGEEYRRYCCHVPRWLPRCRPWRP